MKVKLVRGFALLLVLFLLLFLGRWWLLYQLSQNINVGEITTQTCTATDAITSPVVSFGAIEDGSTNFQVAGVTRSFSSMTHNYAKESLYVNKNLGADIQLASPLPKQLKRKPVPAVQEETYEKIGSLSSWTRDFDSDEKKIRDSLASNKVLIQQENNSGLKGGRLLNLALGVVPEKFEAVIEDIRKVGNLASFSVTKTDKTNDYKTLMAQRASVEKNRVDLIALKAKGGKMSELLDLQERIFQLNKVLEDLGVQIGQFEGQTSLCTVLVTLREVGPALSFWVFASPAFHWALGELFSVITYIFFLALALLALVWALEKGKGLPPLVLSKLSVEKADRKK